MSEVNCERLTLAIADERASASGRDLVLDRPASNGLFSRSLLRPATKFEATHAPIWCGFLVSLSASCNGLR